MKNKGFSLVILVGLNLLTACGEDQMGQFIAHGGTSNQQSNNVVVFDEQAAIQESQTAAGFLTMSEVDLLLRLMTSQTPVLAAASPVGSALNLVKGLTQNLSSNASKVWDRFQKLSNNGKKKMIAFMQALSTKLHAQQPPKQPPVVIIPEQTELLQLAEDIFTYKLNSEEKFYIAGFVLELNKRAVKANEIIEYFFQTYDQLKDKSRQDFRVFAKKWYIENEKLELANDTDKIIQPAIEEVVIIEPANDQVKEDVAYAESSEIQKAKSELAQSVSEKADTAN
jgi:hypothetical protein